MKILAIQPFMKGYSIFPLAGGKDKAALEIARALGRDGHEIAILPLPWGLERRNNDLVCSPSPILLSSDGLAARVCQTITFPSPGEARSLLWRFLTNRRSLRQPYVSARDLIWGSFTEKRRSIARAVRENFDLILVHQSGSDVPVIARECGFRGQMVLVHHSAGVSAFVTRYDHVVFVSEAQRASAVARYPELSERSSVIHYFASEEYFAPVDPAPRREITFIGVLENLRKGIDLLLQAYVEQPALREVPLHVIGDGPMRGQWEALVREHNLPVTFHGRISHTENARILARSGAFVMPSRGEGLALAYLEALCMGVPIVGFPPNVQEIESVLGRPVGHGFRADIDALPRLATLILSLVSPDSSCTAEDRRELSRAVRARFSLETFHQNYANFIRQREKGPS